MTKVSRDELVASIPLVIERPGVDVPLGVVGVPVHVDNKDLASRT